jgi:hypothetical protein
MFLGLFLVLPLFWERLSMSFKVTNLVAIIAYQEATWSIILSPWIKRKLNVKYSTVQDIAHEIDRMPAFFIIILGEFVYSIVVGSPAGVGFSAGYVQRLLAL